MLNKKNHSFSKKATIAFNFLVMLPRIIFLIVMLIACVILLGMFINSKFDVNDVQAEVLINSMIYGVGGVSYYDPVTGRVYPQIIDIVQLDSAELDQSLYFPENRAIAAKITVSTGLFMPVLKTVYFNKYWYDNWKPLFLSRLTGIGGIHEHEKRLPVILRMPSGELKSGQVVFHVVQPNSLRSGG